MSVDLLIARLDRPRRTGPHSWRAPCPAHGGQNRSALAISESENGTILIHCHAHGCGAVDIVTAVGLELHDLFPPSIREPFHHRRGIRRPFNLSDILAAMAHELTCAAIVVCDIAKRGSATDDERVLLLTLAGTLNGQVEVVRGH